jgi:hypothetical protein
MPILYLGGLIFAMRKVPTGTKLIFQIKQKNTIHHSVQRKVPINKKINFDASMA